MNLNQLVMDYVFNPTPERLGKIQEYPDFREDSDNVLIVKLCSAVDTYDRARVYNQFKELHHNDKDFKRYHRDYDSKV